MQDAVELLQKEHQTVRDLCAEVHGLLLGDAPADELLRVEACLKAALLIHVGLEDRWSVSGNAHAMAREEHRIIRWMISELQDPMARHEARWLVLLDLVDRHLRRERRDIFPVLRKAPDGPSADELSTALNLLRQGISNGPLDSRAPRAVPNWPGRELADPARKRTVPLTAPRFRL